ncbi:MAG: hypothetical protein P4L43_07415 [Syntrophobacteraceae bacterium]|nr:hypothetical protein [Syntrophobacteraceae bacterium]
MTDTESLDYFLFPHMTLSPTLLKNMSVFFTRLNVLEIIGSSIPDWAKESVYGCDVINDAELFSRIKASIEGYREFAQVRGGSGGVLGYLKQALDDIDEPRYKIQEQLRGKIAQEKDTRETPIVEASVFLEMARELDEKELEIHADYDRVNAIEREFRDILGMEDEELEKVGADLPETLVRDENGLLFMLAKRIKSWFLMLSRRPVASRPVFVAAFPEVAAEALDILRAGCERSGTDFSTAAFTLGPLPWPGRHSLPPLDDPEVLSAFSSCRSGLDDFIRSAARGEESAKLEKRRQMLQSAFEELCTRCQTPENARASLLVTVVEKICLASIPGLSPMPLLGDEKTWPPIFLSFTSGWKI